MKTLLAIAFLCLISLSCAAQTAAKGFGPWQSLKFKTYAGDSISYQLAMLNVPENRSASGSHTIQLKVVRLISKSASGLSPIVFLAGGPGQSGINYLRQEYFQKLVLHLRQNHDVILLDQRGSGGSQPSLVYRVPDADIKNIFLSDKNIIAVADSQAKAGADTLKKRGIDIRGYNTIQNADDINDLRIALGSKKLNLLAISYGTHLALNVARQHPLAIDRMVLIGVSGPDHMHHLPSSYDKQLQKIAYLAKNDTAINNNVPDMIALLKKVLLKIERQPAVVSIHDNKAGHMVDVAVGKFGLQFILRLDAGDTYDIVNFPALLYGIDKGDYTLLQQYAEKRYNQFNSNYASGIGVMRTASGATAKRFEQIKREGRTALLGNSMNTPDFYGKNYWGDIDLGDAFRASIKSNIAALFVSGTLDSNTPPANADEVKSGFNKSQSLLVKYAGHEDMLPDSEVQQVITDFFDLKKISVSEVTLPKIQFKNIFTKNIE